MIVYYLYHFKKIFSLFKKILKCTFTCLLSSFYYLECLLLSFFSLVRFCLPFILYASLIFLYIYCKLLHIFFLRSGELYVNKLTTLNHIFKSLKKFKGLLEQKSVGIRQHQPAVMRPTPLRAAEGRLTEKRPK